MYTRVHVCHVYHTCGMYMRTQMTRGFDCHQASPALPSSRIFACWHPGEAQHCRHITHRFHIMPSCARLRAVLYKPLLATLRLLWQKRGFCQGKCTLYDMSSSTCGECIAVTLKACFDRQQQSRACYCLLRSPLAAHSNSTAKLLCNIIAHNPIQQG